MTTKLMASVAFGGAFLFGHFRHQYKARCIPGAWSGASTVPQVDQLKGAGPKSRNIPSSSRPGVIECSRLAVHNTETFTHRNSAYFSCCCAKGPRRPRFQCDVDHIR